MESTTKGVSNAVAQVGANTLEAVKAHPVMQEIVKDSFGGVMYNVANRDKYDTTELLALWDELTPAEKEGADGIVKGAINFVTGN